MDADGKNTHEKVTVFRVIHAIIYFVQHFRPNFILINSDINVASLLQTNVAKKLVVSC